MTNKQMEILDKVDRLLWQSGRLVDKVVADYEGKYGTYKIGWIGLGRVRDKLTKLGYVMTKTNNLF